MEQAGRRLFAISWLFLLHSLADVTIGLYRCHDVAPGITDTLAAALPRAQIALLAIWLVVGRERLNWRVCGLIGGLAFIFTVFTRLLFPGFRRDSAYIFWNGLDWMHYFRPSGPGDLLVKTPVIIGVIAGVLVLWRLILAVVRHRRFEWSSVRQHLKSAMQFRFIDAGIWILACCVVLVAIYETVPYESWIEQFRENYGRIYQMRTTPATYTIASGALYGWLGILMLWAAYNHFAFTSRWIIVAASVLLPGVAAEAAVGWYVQGDSLRSFSELWYAATNETVIAALSALAIYGSLWLVKLYEAPVRVRRIQPGRRLPAVVEIQNQDRPVDSEETDEPVLAMLADDGRSTANEAAPTINVETHSGASG